jgi:Tfp pilus assembly protein PilV
MLPVAFTLAGRVLRRLRGQVGMTMVETMVAAVILSAGVLGVFVMVETSDKVNADNRAREGATGLSRELLESARATPYSNIGNSNWFNTTLTNLEGRSSNVVSPTSHSQRTEVKRRGYTYTVDVTTCSVDDSKDGYGGHTAGSWCTDSPTTGSTDSTPEDFKRVAVTTQWTKDSKTYSLYQTATFSSAGSVVGPALTTFELTSPPVPDKSAPVITSNPGDGKAVFTAVSLGAADMKFSVDGVEQVSGASGGNGTWTFDWDILPLKDGVYTIGATAIDALGTRGDPQYIQVKLARGAPTPVTNVIGGYNDVYSGGVKTRVVELAWDGSPDGSVTGYEVVKGTTTVCAASLATECMDLNPATSGSTIYTIKTLYTDAAGNPGFVSTNHTVTAPTGGSTNANTFYFTEGSTITRGGCMVAPNTFTRPGRQVDGLTTPNTGTEKQWTYSSEGNAIIACLPPFQAPATIASNSTNGMTVSMWLRNTGSVQCQLQVVIYKGTSYLSAPSYGSPIYTVVPAGTTTPTLFTKNLSTTSGTFNTGEQLSLVLGGFGKSSNKNPADNCQSTTLYWNSGARPLTVTVNALTGGGLGGGGGGGTIARPAAPTGLTATANGDNTTTLTWNAPSGTPAAEFYRIYRDGQNYTERLDTAGDTGSGTIQFIDPSTGGTTHTYRVTAVSNALAESDPAGPITR